MGMSSSTSAELARLFPSTAELARLFMRGVPPPPPGDPSEDVYFNTLFENFAAMAEADPAVDVTFNITTLLGGPAHEQVYSWLDRQRAAAKPGGRSW